MPEPDSLRVLALEPYCGGSHQAFLERWLESSRHRWKLLTLPAHHWKWRMRHAAVTFARQAAGLTAEGAAWDVVFCSDMLPLADAQQAVARYQWPLRIASLDDRLEQAAERDVG